MQEKWRTKNYYPFIEICISLLQNHFLIFCGTKISHPCCTSEPRMSEKSFIRITHIGMQWFRSNTSKHLLHRTMLTVFVHHFSEITSLHSSFPPSQGILESISLIMLTTVLTVMLLLCCLFRYRRTFTEGKRQLS